jgi:hypothetical protein
MRFAETRRDQERREFSGGARIRLSALDFSLRLGYIGALNTKKRTG